VLVRLVRRRAAAQALVETALVLPLLLMLSLGLLQVALYAHARDVLLGAVQEGARLAAEDGRTLDDGLARVGDLTRAGLGSSVEPLLTHARADSDVVEITVDTQLRPIVALPLPDGLPIHVRASMSRERFRPNGGHP
jgi:Flp pilus assembly protein TadG